MPLSASTESLATNTQGATFAAKARAAELQAARSRRELQSKVPERAVNTGHETMTFKAKKNRGWKPLDLRELTEVEEDGGINRQEPDFSLASHELSETSHDDSSQSQATLYNPTRRHITLNELMRHKGSIPGIQRDMKPGAGSELSGENNQGSDEYAAESNYGESASGSEHPDQRIRLTSYGSFPLLNTAQNRDARAAGRQVQSEDNQFGEQMFQPHSLYRSEGSSVATVKPTAALEQQARNTYGNDPFMTSMPPLKPKPARQYPAVKGTAAAVNQMANPPSLLNLIRDASLPESPVVDRRKPSYHDENGLLLQKLQQTADSAGPSSIEATPRPSVARAVLSSEPRRITSRSVSSNVHPSPASLTTPRGPKNLPPGLSAQALPSASSVARSPHVAPDETTERTADERLAEADAWWRRDARFDRRLRVHMADLLADAQHATTPRPRRRESSLLGARADDAPAAYRSPPPGLYATPPHAARVAPGGRPVRGTPPRAPPASAVPPVPRSSSPRTRARDRAMAHELLLPVLATLKAYTATPRGPFNPHGAAPPWACDPGPRGGAGSSLFERDWGAPPPRVGRDPRYRAVADARGAAAAFDDFAGRWGRAAGSPGQRAW